MNTAQRFFVFDVESIGLHGEAFAVAGGITDGVGGLTHEFLFVCPPELAKGLPEDYRWVQANCPRFPDYNCVNVAEVRQKFWKMWHTAKEVFPDITMAVECGWPVEANFLRMCIDDLPDDERFSGPYPLHEIASFMLTAGMDPMATYDRLPDELPKHHPLKDARQSARLLFEASKHEAVAVANELGDCLERVSTAFGLVGTAPQISEKLTSLAKELSDLRIWKEDAVIEMKKHERMFLELESSKNITTNTPP